MTQRRIVLAAFAFLVLEAVLVAFVDRPISEYVRGLDQNDTAFIGIFRAYTDLGKSMWYLWPSAAGIVLCAGLLRFPALTHEKRVRIADIGKKLLFLLATVGLSGIVTDIIKPIVGRARPVELVREGFYGFRPFSGDAALNSMPSGHTTTAAALAFVLIALLPRGRVLWLAFAFLIGLSRVMVNAHYTADVLAGAVVGTVIAKGIQKALSCNGMFHVMDRIFPIDRKNTMP